MHSSRPGRSKVLRTVLLLHEQEGEPPHLDWMIQGRSDKERGLVTFRLEAGLFPVWPGRFTGERLGDHRAVYLEYVGPITGGRGMVSRLASGTILGSLLANSLAGSLALGPLRGTVLGGAGQGGQWDFEFEAASDFTPDESAC